MSERFETLLEGVWAGWEGGVKGEVEGEVEGKGRVWLIELVLVVGLACAGISSTFKRTSKVYLHSFPLPEILNIIRLTCLHPRRPALVNTVEMLTQITTLEKSNDKTAKENETLGLYIDNLYVPVSPGLR